MHNELIIMTNLFFSQSLQIYLKRGIGTNIEIIFIEETSKYWRLDIDGLFFLKSAFVQKMNESVNTSCYYILLSYDYACYAIFMY